MKRRIARGNVRNWMIGNRRREAEANVWARSCFSSEGLSLQLRKGRMLVSSILLLLLLLLHEFANERSDLLSGHEWSTLLA